MSIRVQCLTVAIRKSAVERVYPGGLAAFVRAYGPVAEDVDLVGRGFMSSGEVYRFLDVLAAIGLDPARDFAAGDGFVGVLQCCDGIAFEPMSSDPLGGWQVMAKPFPPEAPPTCGR